MNPTSHRAARRAASLLAALATAAALPVHGQRLAIAPATDVLAGTPLTIAAEDLVPGSAVSLRSERRVRGWDGQPRLFRAQAAFAADAGGRVDLARAAPVSGSYEGADIQGLFWSAAATADPVPADLAEGEVRLTLDLPDRPGAASATLTVRPAAQALRAVAAPGFSGAELFRLPDDVVRPALIALGGSEGGSLTVKAAARRLASHGYAVLALPYHSPQRWGPQGPIPPELPDLPQAFASLPVERLQAARDWLMAQSGVDPRRVGLYGVSKGAEFALLAAVRMPWVASVVAVVPTDVSWEGWGPGTVPGVTPSFSWQGRPVPFVPYQGMAEEMQGFAAGREVRLRRPQDAGRAAHPDRAAAARIPVEDYAGPLLVIGGHADAVWDSGGMAQAIAERRRAAGRDTEALVYPQAGHSLSGPGWQPTTAFNDGPMKAGGTPAADGRALAEAWPRTLAFLARTLGPVPR